MVARVEHEGHRHSARSGIRRSRDAAGQAIRDDVGPAEVSMTETTGITIALPDGGSLPAAFATPIGIPGPRPAVLVLHEAIGLNDDIRRIAGRFADAGYIALAPDFLAGLGPKPICIARFVRSLARIGTGRAYRQLDAARAWLAARADVADRGIGVAGFCVGGGFALLYSAGASVDVVAPFYAAAPTEEVLAGICPVVASYGGRDRIFASHAERLETSLNRLGIEHDVRTYPSAGHSFMNRHGRVTSWIEARLPTRGGFDAAASDDAWRRTLDYFDRHLQAA
jgi:carboxymethylenebutenolidase